MTKSEQKWRRPPKAGFIYLDQVVSGVRVDMRYATHQNFTGACVPGYLGRRVIVTRQTAAALRAVQGELTARGWCLLIWDAYRPQRAVDAFVAWRSQAPDAETKQEYFPTYSKEELFAQGLIASPSAHSRGSTVDLTIVTSEGGRAVDMGGAFDLFSPKSATAYPNLTKAQRENRAYLCDLMDRHGFTNFASEWWHYTLRDEPFPDTYFNFEIRDDWEL